MIYLNNIIDNLFKEMTIDLEKFNFPNYPVSNTGYTKDGNFFIEIAVTGFEKDEIDISIESIPSYSLLTVKTAHKKNDISEKEYFIHNIAKRGFVSEYKLSTKCDIEKINTEMKNGILTITIPLKDEIKPKIKKLNIN